MLATIGTRNGLFYGFFYVALGDYISKNQFEKHYYSWLIIFGLVLLAIESSFGVLYLHVTSTIMWLSTPIPVFALFMVAKQMDLGINTLKLRHTCSFMYFSHYLWLLFFKMMGLNEGFIMFVGVSLVSISVAYGVVKLANKFRWLNWTF